MLREENFAILQKAEERFVDSDVVTSTFEIFAFFMNGVVSVGGNSEIQVDFCGAKTYKVKVVLSFSPRFT